MQILLDTTSLPPECRDICKNSRFLTGVAPKGQHSNHIATQAMDATGTVDSRLQAKSLSSGNRVRKINHIISVYTD